MVPTSASARGIVSVNLPRTSGGKWWADAWGTLLRVTVVVAFAGLAGREVGADELRVIKAGNVTQVESNKQGTVGTAVKTGPITTYEFKGGTKVQSVQMGNVTQYKANDGSKATAVDTGPIRTTETASGKSSTVRIGGVTIGPDQKGPQNISVQSNVVFNSDGAVVTGEKGIQAASLIEGSGRSVTEKRALGAFSTLVVSGIVDVEVEIGKAAGATVTAEAEILPFLETAVSGNKLKIGFRKSVRFSQTAKVIVTVPDLVRLESSGDGNLKVVGVRGAAFTLKSGGTAEVVLAGKTGKFEAYLEGTGNLDAQGLAAEDAKITLDGTASAHVKVRNLLTAEIKGVGDVICHGRPQQVRKKIDGVGDCVIVE